VAVRSDNRPAFDALLAAGANPATSDRGGRSALYWAILERQREMAILLIEHGVDYSWKFDGHTPLQMARMMRRADVVAALLRRGATD
jgi:ankyrin repeat protein